jgi:hypothetical protein
MSEPYIPGTCNIAGAQLHKRKRFMAKSLGLTVWAIALIQILGLPKWCRLPMVILFTLSAIGIQQVYFKFCYVFGLKGLIGRDELGKVEKTEDAYRELDRKKAQRMILSSILYGVILTLIYYFLPI